MWIMDHYKLRDYILSMDYSDTNIEIPPIHRITRLVEMDPNNQLCYLYVSKVARKVYDDVLSGAASFAGVLKLLVRLRQCCIAPCIMVQNATDLPKQEKDADVNFTQPTHAEPGLGDEMAELYRGALKDWVKDEKGTAGLQSPKIQELVRIVREVPRDEKIIVFSTFISVLHLAHAALLTHLRQDEIAQLDGETPGKKRNEILARFRASDKSGPRVLLVSTKVGGEGLNLVEANHVIHMEPWWSPVVSQQCEARAWRPGQTKPVYSYYIIATQSDKEVTVENRILELCQGKQKLSDKLLFGAQDDDDALDRDDDGGINFQRVEQTMGIDLLRDLLNF